MHVTETGSVCLKPSVEKETENAVDHSSPISVKATSLNMRYRNSGDVIFSPAQKLNLFSLKSSKDNDEHVTLDEMRL